MDTNNGQQNVGSRYLWWDHYTAPKLTAAERGRVLDKFAAEFADVSRTPQPWDGWGETMADLCWRMAARLRGGLVAPADGC